MGKMGNLHYKRTFQHVKGFTAGLLLVGKEVRIWKPEMA